VGHATLKCVKVVGTVLNQVPELYALAPSVQKVLSGSDRAGRLRLMEKYVGLRLVTRPELYNTFWTDSPVFCVTTMSDYRGIGKVQVRRDVAYTKILN